MTRSIFSKSYAEFLNLLVSERHKMKLTQDDVAKRLGRPQSFVSKYENGERRLDIIELFEILNAYGTDPLDFVSRLDKSN
jgi:transcriptional regulator with XRE-family HTH domain